MWHGRLLSLARLCIARSVNLEKAEIVLLLVITGDCNITESCPPTDSEVRLRAINTLGNLCKSQGLNAKAETIYRNSILVLQALDRPNSNWLRDACENYVTVAPPDFLQESELRSSAFLPKIQDVLRLVRKIKVANDV